MFRFKMSLKEYVRKCFQGPKSNEGKSLERLCSRQDGFSQCFGVAPKLCEIRAVFNCSGTPAAFSAKEQETLGSMSRGINP